MIVNGSVVFADPHAGRTRNQSSWYCIGGALLDSVEAHNEAHPDAKVTGPDYTGFQLSRKIIRSARTWIGTSPIAKYAGKKSMQEISTQDPSALHKSLHEIYPGMCKEYRILELCEGNWAAREAVRQALLNDKADKTRKDLSRGGNTKSLPGHKKFPSSRRQDRRKSGERKLSKAEILKRNKNSSLRNKNASLKNKNASLKNKNRKPIGTFKMDKDVNRTERSTFSSDDEEGLDEKRSTRVATPKARRHHKSKSHRGGDRNHDDATDAEFDRKMKKHVKRKKRPISSSGDEEDLAERRAAIPKARRKSKTNLVEGSSGDDATNAELEECLTELHSRDDGCQGLDAPKRGSQRKRALPPMQFGSDSESEEEFNSEEEAYAMRIMKAKSRREKRDLRKKKPRMSNPSSKSKARDSIKPQQSSEESQTKHQEMSQEI